MWDMVRCYCDSKVVLRGVTHLDEGFLQSLLCMLQVSLVGLQVCRMLACISEQELHAFQLAAPRLHAISTRSVITPCDYSMLSS